MQPAKGSPTPNFTHTQRKNHDCPVDTSHQQHVRSLWQKDVQGWQLKADLYTLGEKVALQRSRVISRYTVISVSVIFHFATSLLP